MDSAGPLSRFDFAPLPCVDALGQKLGRSALRGRRSIAERNIELCFPDLGPDERQRLLEAHFESLGMGVMEVGIAWWWPAEKITKLIELDGLGHLERAASKGKGVLLFGAHVTSLELGGRILADRFPLDVMYCRSNNAVVEYVMTKARGRVCRQLIQRNEVKTLIRSLKQGHAIWYAPDQNTQRKKAVFVDFFGHKAATTPATARLALMMGAEVVPFQFARRGDGSGYRLQIEPPLTDFPTGDLVRDTQRTSDIIAG